ncbi:MAG: DUF3343 domain-containing protein [Atopococcus tabaci]|uniref:DUF3343 domain-containing protein n=1 Tax=Atopococcus tabaci TaxID=269774 RepID=A0AA43UD49_9LACT|nr:DUF3343 domain-containing protein [Atopococcus tabaci]
MSVQHLILFEDVTKGTALFKLLSQQGFECKVSFSPPEVEKACGIAIEYFNLEDKEDIIKIADTNSIEIKQFYEYKK